MSPSIVQVCKSEEKYMHSFVDAHLTITAEPFESECSLHTFMMLFSTGKYYADFQMSACYLNVKLVLLEHFHQ